MASAPRTNAPEERPVADFDVTKTPEFQAALNEAVGKALSDALGPLKEQISAARQGDVVDAGHVDGGAESLLQRLAHLIADVSDQGSGRPVRLPPELVAKRERSRVLMFKALTDMQERVKSLRAAGKKGEARAALPRFDTGSANVRAPASAWSGEYPIFTLTTSLGSSSNASPLNV